MECVLRMCDIAREDWVMLATSLLEGGARLFWETLDEDMATSLLWEDFRNLFQTQFPSQAAPRAPAPETAGPVPRTPTVTFTIARDFVLRAESVFMSRGDTVVSYLARATDEVLPYNTVFNLSELERSQIIWRGLTERFKRRVTPQAGQTFIEFITEVTRVEQDMRRERRTARDFPFSNTRVSARHDAEASTSRPRPPAEDEEDEPSPIRRRVTREAIAEEDGSEDAISSGSEEDPEEFPDDEDEDPTPRQT